MRDEHYGAVERVECADDCHAAAIYFPPRVPFGFGPGLRSRGTFAKSARRMM